MTRRFVFKDEKSHKFWEISVEDTLLRTRWGKVGSDGQSKEKSLDDPDKALKDAEKQIKSKLKKGYVEESSDSSVTLDEDGMPTWQHPRLGKFEYEPGEWFQEEKELDAYFYFSVDDEEDDDETWVPPQPSSEEVELACRVYDARETLVGLAAEALWNDFHGKGPGSGMWWRNSFAEVVESLSFCDASEPQTAEQLSQLLHFNSVRVSHHDKLDGRQLAQLSFRADFEEEHGVGVLTDGENILGLGYSGEASPFLPATTNESTAKPEESLRLTKSPIWPKDWVATVFPRRGDQVSVKSPESILTLLREKLAEKSMPPAYLKSMPKTSQKIYRSQAEKDKKLYQRLLSELAGSQKVKLKNCRRMMKESQTRLLDWIPYICGHHGLQAAIDIKVRELEEGVGFFHWQTRGSAEFLETITALRLHVVASPQSDFEEALEYYQKKFPDLVIASRALLYFLFQEPSWRTQMLEDFKEPGKESQPFLELVLLSGVDLSPFETVLSRVGYVFYDADCAPGLREHIALYLQERLLEVNPNLLSQKGLTRDQETRLAETLSSLPHPTPLRRLAEICEKNRKAKSQLNRAHKNFPEEMGV